MAEPDAQESEAPKAEKAGGSANTVRFLIGVAALLAVVVIAGGVSYWIATNGPSMGSSPMEVEVGLDDRGGQELGPAPATYDLGNFTSIAYDGSGRSYNLRAQIIIAFPAGDGEEATRAELEARKIVLQDRIREVLNRVNPADFTNNQSQAWSDLKSQVLRVVTQSIPREHRIEAVLVPEGFFSP